MRRRQEEAGGGAVRGRAAPSGLPPFSARGHSLSEYGGRCVVGYAIRGPLRSKIRHTGAEA
eukprot:1955174-Rhodomonas_salina.1